MKKNLLFVIILACLTMPTLADEIKFFKGSWQNALAEAKKTKKLIFVDAYAVWCGPCKFMEKNVFTQKEVAQFYNQNFICYKLDVDKETQLSQQFAIEAMPTFLFVTEEAKVAHKKVGGMEAQNFLQLGQEALKIPTLQAQYDKGDRKPTFVREYLTLMQENKTPAVLQAAKDFFAQLSDKDLLDPENFKIMMLYTNDANSREFKYFYSNKTTFYNTFKEEAKAPIINVYQTLYAQAVESQDIKYVTQIQSMLQNAYPIIEKEKAEGISQRTFMDFYKRIKQYGKYKELAVSYVEKYAQFDEETLLTTAYDFFTISDKAEDLAWAEKWTRRALQAGDSYEVLHFLAEILQKMGKKAEAIKEAKKALQYAKNNGVEDYSKTEYLLQTLEKK